MVGSRSDQSIGGYGFGDGAQRLDTIYRAIAIAIASQFHVFGFWIIGGGKVLNAVGLEDLNQGLRERPVVVANHYKKFPAERGLVSKGFC